MNTQEHDSVRIRHPFSVRDPVRITMEIDFGSLLRDFAILLVHSNQIKNMPERGLSRLVRRRDDPTPVGRPSGPTGFSSPAEMCEQTRRRRFVGRLDPDIIRVVFVRVKRDPLSVRRPAQALIFGRRSDDNLFRRLGWDLFVRGYRAQILRNVGVMEIVQNAPPASERESDVLAGWIPGWRFGLQRRERRDRPSLGAEGCDRGLKVLKFEENASVARHRRRIGVTAKARVLDWARLTASNRNGPKIHRLPLVGRPGLIGCGVIEGSTVWRERDRTISRAYPRHRVLAARKCDDL